MPECHLLALPGLTPYDDAFALQRTLSQRRAAQEIPDTLILLEHPPTITLGRKSDPNDFLTPRETLAARGFDIREIERGGEITYHAPGQLVGYPILDLRQHGQDLHRYLRDLEEVVIRTLAAFGLTGTRVAGRTGVWVGDAKIAALGIHVSRWVSRHGFALNLDPDLRPFREDFVPCGIRDRGVTSLAELRPGETWDRARVEPVVQAAFTEVFRTEWV